MPRYLPSVDKVGNLYNECLRKKKYNGLDQAMRIAKRAEQERGTKLRYYTCRYCGKYHLTKVFA